MILFIIYESNEMEWVTQLHKIARHRMKESKHIPIVFVYFKYFWYDFISLRFDLCLLGVSDTLT